MSFKTTMSPFSLFVCICPCQKEEEEPVNLVKCHDKAPTVYGMEITAKKTKPMTNNTSGINTEIKIMRKCMPRSSRQLDHMKTS